MFVPVRFTFCSLHSVSRHAGCLFFSPAVTCTLWRTGLILKNAVTSPPPQYLGEQFPNSKKSPVEAFCNHPVLALLRNHWSVFHPSSFASFQICHINETKLRTAWPVESCFFHLANFICLGTLYHHIRPSHSCGSHNCLLFFPSLYFSIFLLSIPDSGCISYSDCFLPWISSAVTTHSCLINFHKVTNFTSPSCSSTFKNFPLTPANTSNSHWHSKPIKFTAKLPQFSFRIPI